MCGVRHGNMASRPHTQIRSSCEELVNMEGYVTWDMGGTLRSTGNMEILCIRLVECGVQITGR